MLNDNKSGSSSVVIERIKGSVGKSTIQNEGNVAKMVFITCGFDSFDKLVELNSK